MIWLWGGHKSGIPPKKNYAHFPARILNEIMAPSHVPIGIVSLSPPPPPRPTCFGVDPHPSLQHELCNLLILTDWKSAWTRHKHPTPPLARTSGFSLCAIFVLRCRIYHNIYVGPWTWSDFSGTSSNILLQTDSVLTQATLHKKKGWGTVPKWVTWDHFQNTRQLGCMPSDNGR
jgi:hypothetical protein